MPRLDFRPDLDFTYHFPSNFWDKLRVGLGLGVGIVLNYSRMERHKPRRIWSFQLWFGPRQNVGLNTSQMFCSVTTVWTVKLDFMRHLLLSWSPFITLLLSWESDFVYSKLRYVVSERNSWILQWQLYKQNMRALIINV